MLIPYPNWSTSSRFAVTALDGCGYPSRGRLRYGTVRWGRIFFATLNIQC